MDGPVAKAAGKALEEANVNFVLPWIHEQDEQELKAAYDLAFATRRTGKVPQVTKVSDLWFCETAVRLHMKGRNAPYTGLKPAGLDEGPIIPMATRSLETGNSEELIQLLSDAVREELQERFETAIAWQGCDVNDVKAGREYVQAMLGFMLYAHELCEFVKGCELGKKSDERQDLKEINPSVNPVVAGELASQMASRQLPPALDDHLPP